MGLLSREEIDMEEERQPLINWCPQSRKITTQYGTVTYKKFCQLEQVRIGKHTQVLRRGDEVCLMD